MPGVSFLRERLYEYSFPKRFGNFKGVFETFAQARSAAPPGSQVDFDCLPYSEEYKDRRSQIFSFDYPVLFWLKPLLSEGCTLFDFGGHLGTHFYAYSKYMDYPSGMRWLVCDLPLITEIGRQLLRETGRSGLSFTNEFNDGDGADILLASGSLQYIETPSFAELLRSLSNKPCHLLINKIPLYPGKQFVTLQNGGVVFSPQYVFNRETFIAGLVALGYELMDTWNVETHHGRIPFHPDRSFPCHSGLYFKLRDSRDSLGAA
jgi:putative methyltransferase (TIGR04325 family)